MVKVNGAPSQAAIGRALNLSAAAVTKLKHQGMPVDSVESAQAWRVARQNIARRKPEPALLALPAPLRPAPAMGEPMDDETHDQARTRREIAEANLAELKLAELRGDVIRATDVRAAHSRRLAALRESLLQVPSRLAAVLAAEADMQRVHDHLQAEMLHVLEHLAATA